MQDKRTEIQGNAVVIPGDDIDTDRIIPARFLKEITFKYMGNYLFYDERFDAQNNPTDFPLNAVLDTRILIVGSNFGCGSSREHAPQAIKRYGIQALIGLSFSDIFSGNCHALGVPCVCVSPSDHHAISTTSHSKLIAISLLTKTITNQHDQKSWPLLLSDAIHHSLITGEWHVKSLLQSAKSDIDRVATQLPYINNFQ